MKLSITKKAMPVMKSSSNIQSNLLLHFVNSQEEFKVEIWTEVVRKWKSLQLVHFLVEAINSLSFIATFSALEWTLTRSFISTARQGG